MNKIFLGLLLVELIIVPVVGLAQPVTTNPPDLDVPTTIDNILDWAFGILIFIAAFFIIVGGYYYVTAGGDAAKIGTARNFLVYALIGVAVAFLARGLVAFVNTVLTT